MATDKELMKAFQEQFQTGRLFTESNVLVLMGYARGEAVKDMKASKNLTKETGFTCPYTKGACVYIDTAGPAKTKECSECEYNEDNL